MSFKLWFRAGAIAVVSLALSTTIAVAQGNGHGHDKHDRDDDDHGRGNDRHEDRDHDRGHGHEAREHGNGHGYGHYKDRDRDIHDWYRTHYSHLPPGLAKRDRLPPGLERQLIVNGTLPPGLRAKMEPCPRELEVMLPPPDPGYRHVFIGGNLVLVNRVSFQVADVFHFDAAF